MELTIGMNEFINCEAFPEQEIGLNKTFLLFSNAADRIAGYISLCSDSLRLSDEEKGEENLPYATVPSVKVARLAIHKDFQGQGLGKQLINFAASKVFKMREEFCGVKFLTVDCYEHRVGYYKKHGFVINASSQDEHGSNLTSLRLNVDEYAEGFEVT